MVLSEQGTKLLLAHEAWKKYCEQENIEDPWQLMEQCEEKINKHWTEIDENGHTIWHYETHSFDEWPKELQEEYNHLKKYRNQYMITREIWEGDYIFKNFDYDTLTFFAQTHGPEETAFWQWYAQLHPCESADGQCLFSCPIFQTCALKTQGQFE